MSAFLPQHDPDPHLRILALQDAQNIYKYNYLYVSPLAIVERVPIKDDFSFNWLVAVAERVSHTLANRADLEAASEFRDLHAAKNSVLKILVAAGECMIGGLKQIVAEALKFDVRLGAPCDRPQQLEDYAKLFRAIGLPPIASSYANDLAFAWQRVAGPNPVMLTRLNARDTRFALTDSEFALVVPGDSFNAAQAEGRLYLADYSILDGAEQGDFPHGQKYVYAPLALFVIDKTNLKLKPVAIQCQQKPAADNPIFTPLDGTNWLIAKTIVEIADGNVHEAFTHLGRTHLFMEPFVVSTFRQLAPNHPVARLLSPHFEGTLAINEAAWKHLIAHKGAVDKLFGGSIDASRGLTAKGVQSQQVMRGMFPCTFTDRGVDDVTVFPQYPYRDDALLYWGALNKWVSSYLRLYYQADLDVQQDVELQNWCRELSSQDGGRINGLPNNGVLNTFAELEDILTLIVTTCSVQHAAVNFPQYDVMSYVPQMPLAGYSPAPTTKTGATDANYLAMLPTLDMAELQLELGYLLGSVRYTQLGQYNANHFSDIRVNAPLLDLQIRIKAIGNTITVRNQMRLRPYDFLLPTGIPQSINI